LDDSSNDDSDLSLLQRQQEDSEVKIDNTIDYNHVPSSSYTGYIKEDVEWISEDEDEYEEDARPLYNGSSITLSSAVRFISAYYLNASLDKQKINSLLRLIKSLLPKPNILPSTWKSMNKALGHDLPNLITFLCCDCNQPCDTFGVAAKSCVNPNCKTSFRRRRSNEIIEIVRFDIRRQIQTIMSRNSAIINQSHLFPPSDICFGEQYQHTSDKNFNKISLIVHSDGAPLVRSSKKSIWPCFASITEIPPPVREYQSNIIILALWASKVKPNVNIFLEQTVNELLFLIKNGTSIFIDGHEYNIQLATQFFVSDLPAKALLCCTTNFNGYSACTFCYSRGKFFSSLLLY
jgi:hypothetical protein